MEQQHQLLQPVSHEEHHFWVEPLLHFLPSETMISTSVHKMSHETRVLSGQEHTVSIRLFLHEL